MPTARDGKVLLLVSGQVAQFYYANTSAPTRTVGKGLNPLGEDGPSSQQAQRLCQAFRQRRETVTQILDQRVTPHKDLSRGGLFEAAHRAHPLFEMTMITLEAIVQVT